MADRMYRPDPSMPEVYIIESDSPRAPDGVFRALRVPFAPGQDPREGGVSFEPKSERHFKAVLTAYYAGITERREQVMHTSRYRSNFQRLERRAYFAGMLYASVEMTQNHKGA